MEKISDGNEGKQAYHGRLRRRKKENLAKKISAEMAGMMAK